MVVKFDTPKTDSKGKLANSGSSSAFVNYLSKEDALSKEEWFCQSLDECHPAEVRAVIDSDHQGIGKSEGKFATGSINPTAEEWQALGKTEKERLDNFKAWIQKDFSQEFADNFKKTDKAGNVVTIEPQNVKIYYKVEHDRYYTGHDKEVKNGLKLQGEPKEGFNKHCHFIVARKTKDGKSRISPTTNNRKEFDRDGFTHRIEKNFDYRVGYERPLKESYEYMKTMKNGTGQQKSEMLQKAANLELRNEIVKSEALEKKILQEKSLEKNKTQKLSRGMSL